MSTKTGTTVDFFISLSSLLNFHFQAWTWQLTMLQIYVTLWEVGLCVCTCVSLSVCVILLRTFITLSTLQNPFDKHIAYFNQNG